MARSQNDGQTLTSDWTEIDKFRCNMPRYKVCKDFSSDINKIKYLPGLADKAPPPLLGTYVQ